MICMKKLSYQGAYFMISLLLAIIYISFISLGLPDGLLGAAWPSMYQEINVPVSYAGVVSMLIAGGTIVSSLASDRLTRKLGTGGVTAISVAMTAIALFGFSYISSFWMLCLWALPYGLGAGSVDAALNNYVALHFKSRHMSWLHCFWGVGASAGPYIISWCLTGGKTWNNGYQVVGVIQIVLTAILFISLPLWRRVAEADEQELSNLQDNITDIESQNDTDINDLPDRHYGIKDVIRIPGVLQIMITFFAYCAMEATAGLWAASYFVLDKGISSDTAAKWASLFYVGITVGRFVSGFATMKLNDKQMVRLGQIICAVGMVVLALGDTPAVMLVGMILIGLGCAPIYPSIIHATPIFFGRKYSQAVIGLEMSSAYVGTCLMPPIFGQLAEHINISLFPIFLGVILVLMWILFGVATLRIKRNA